MLAESEPWAGNPFPGPSLGTGADNVWRVFVKIFRARLLWFILLPFQGKGRRQPGKAVRALRRGAVCGLETGLVIGL